MRPRRAGPPNLAGGPASWAGGPPAPKEVSRRRRAPNWSGAARRELGRDDSSGLESPKSDLGGRLFATVCAISGRGMPGACLPPAGATAEPWPEAPVGAGGGDWLAGSQSRLASRRCRPERGPELAGSSSWASLPPACRAAAHSARRLARALSPEPPRASGNPSASRVRRPVRLSGCSYGNGESVRRLGRLQGHPSAGGCSASLPSALQRLAKLARALAGWLSGGRTDGTC